MNPTQERWLPVVGWEGLYEVSDHGRVRSLDRVVTRTDGVIQRRRGTVLTNTITSSGYAQVRLSGNGRRENAMVHRAVLRAFRGEPLPGQEGCHNNGDSTDPRLENLRWDSSRENTFDSIRHGTHYAATRTHCPYGHQYTADNTYFYSDTYRQCRACKRRRNRERRRAQGLPIT